MPMPPLVLNGEIAGVFFRASLQDGVLSEEAFIKNLESVF